MEKFESFVVTYKGEKYEIADFINRHPGGTEVLLEYKDKDMTKAFDHIGHSDGAMLMLRRRLIKKDGASTSQDEADLAREEAAPAGKVDAAFVYKKLFTNEDKKNFHKTFGFLVLLSFIYRYFYVFPTTGRLGIGQDVFSYFTLFIHAMLSCSSLIFHVLKMRISANPLIIWEEYRLHAIIFTLKGCLPLIFGLFMPYMAEAIRFPLLVTIMLGMHALADYVTAKLGKPGVTSVRHEGKASGYVKYGMRFYAFYQILGQGTFFKIDELQYDLGFNTLIAIQSSAFLMTLKRKNIVDWPAHAGGYTLALILSMSYILYARGSVFCFYMFMLFLARTQLRVNKYVMWITYNIAAHYLLE